MSNQATELRQIRILGPRLSGQTADPATARLWELLASAPPASKENWLDHTLPLRALTVEAEVIALHAVDAGEKATKFPGGQSTVDFQAPLGTSIHLFCGSEVEPFKPSSSASERLILNIPQSGGVVAREAITNGPDEIAFSTSPDSGWCHLIGVPADVTGWPQPIVRKGTNGDPYNEIRVPAFELAAGSIPLKVVGNGIHFFAAEGIIRDAEVLLAPEGIVFAGEAEWLPWSKTVLKGRFLLHIDSEAPNDDAKPGCSIRLLPEELSPDERQTWMAEWYRLVKACDALSGKAGPAFSDLSLRNSGQVPAFFWKALKANDKWSFDRSTVRVPPGDVFLRLLGTRIDESTYDGVAELSASRIDVAKTGDTLTISMSSASKVTEADGTNQLEFTWSADDTEAAHWELRSGPSGGSLPIRLRHDERLLAATLRNAYGLPNPSTATAKESPDSLLPLWAFTPLDCGWLQFPVPNTPPDDASIDEVSRSSSVRTSSAMQGFVRFSTSKSDAAGWSILAERATGFQAEFSLALGGLAPMRAKVRLGDPIVTARGLIWISIDRPDEDDALPRLSAGPRSLIDIPLQTDPSLPADGELAFQLTQPLRIKLDRSSADFESRELEVTWKPRKAVADADHLTPIPKSVEAVLRMTSPDISRAAEHKLDELWSEVEKNVSELAKAYRVYDDVQVRAGRHESYAEILNRGAASRPKKEVLEEAAERERYLARQLRTEGQQRDGLVGRQIESALAALSASNEALSRFQRELKLRLRAICWARHPQLPLAATMPVTRSVRASSSPLASRELAPFAVDARSDIDGSILAVLEWRDSGLLPQVRGDRFTPANIFPWPDTLGEDRSKTTEGVAFALQSVTGVELIPDMNMTSPQGSAWSAVRFSYRYDVPPLDEAFSTTRLPPGKPPEQSEASDPVATAVDLVGLSQYGRRQSELRELTLTNVSRAFDFVAAPRWDGMVTNLFGGHNWNAAFELRDDSDCGLGWGGLTVTNATSPKALLMEKASGTNALQGMNGSARILNNGDVSISGSDADIAVRGWAGSTFSQPAGWIRDAAGIGLSKAPSLGQSVSIIKVATGAADGGNEIQLATLLRPETVAAHKVDGNTEHRPELTFWFRDLPVIQEGEGYLFEASADLSNSQFEHWSPQQILQNGFEWRLFEKEGDFQISMFGLLVRPLRLKSVNLSMDGEVAKVIVVAAIGFMTDERGMIDEGGLISLELSRNSDGLTLTGVTSHGNDASTVLKAALLATTDYPFVAHTPRLVEVEFSIEGTTVCADKIRTTLFGVEIEQPVTGLLDVNNRLQLNLIDSPVAQTSSAGAIRLERLSLIPTGTGRTAYQCSVELGFKRCVLTSESTWLQVLAGSVGNISQVTILGGAIRDSVKAEIDEANRAITLYWNDVRITGSLVTDLLSETWTSSGVLAFTVGGAFDQESSCFKAHVGFADVVARARTEDGLHGFKMRTSWDPSTESVIGERACEILVTGSMKQTSAIRWPQIDLPPANDGKVSIMIPESAPRFIHSISVELRDVPLPVGLLSSTEQSVSLASPWAMVVGVRHQLKGTVDLAERDWIWHSADSIAIWPASFQGDAHSSFVPTYRKDVPDGMGKTDLPAAGIGRTDQWFGGADSAEFADWRNGTGLDNVPILVGGYLGLWPTKDDSDLCRLVRLPYVCGFRSAEHEGGGDYPRSKFTVAWADGPGTRPIRLFSSAIPAVPMDRVSVDCLAATNRLTEGLDVRSIISVGRMVESMLFQPIDNGGSPDSLWLGSAIALNQAIASNADEADAISVLTGRETRPRRSVPARFALVRVHPLNVRTNRTSQLHEAELVSAGDGIDIRSWQDSPDDDDARRRACEQAFAIHYRPRFAVVRKGAELFLPIRLPSPMAADLTAALSMPARESRFELFEDAGLGWPASPFRYPSAHPTSAGEAPEPTDLSSSHAEEPWLSNISLSNIVPIQDASDATRSGLAGLSEEFSPPAWAGSMDASGNTAVAICEFAQPDYRLAKIDGVRTSPVQWLSPQYPRKRQGSRPSLSNEAQMQPFLPQNIRSLMVGERSGIRTIRRRWLETRVPDCEALDQTESRFGWRSQAGPSAPRFMRTPRPGAIPPNIGDLAIDRSVMAAPQLYERNCLVLPGPADVFRLDDPETVNRQFAIFAWIQGEQGRSFRITSDWDGKLTVNFMLVRRGIDKTELESRCGGPKLLGSLLGVGNNDSSRFRLRILSPDAEAWPLGASDPVEIATVSEDVGGNQIVRRDSMVIVLAVDQTNQAAAIATLRQFKGAFVELSLLMARDAVFPDGSSLDQPCTLKLKVPVDSPDASSFPLRNRTVVFFDPAYDRMIVSPVAAGLPISVADAGDQGKLFAIALSDSSACGSSDRIALMLDFRYEKQAAKGADAPQIPDNDITSDLKWILNCHTRSGAMVEYKPKLDSVQYLSTKPQHPWIVDLATQLFEFTGANGKPEVKTVRFEPGDRLEFVVSGSLTKVGSYSVSTWKTPPSVSVHVLAESPIPPPPAAYAAVSAQAEAGPFACPLFAQSPLAHRVDFVDLTRDLRRGLVRRHAVFAWGLWEPDENIRPRVYVLKTDRNGQTRFPESFDQFEEDQQMLPTFTQLEANYPMDEHNALFIDVLGGGFAQLVDKDDYRNTCAIRMSVAFNRCGAPIPKSLADKDGGHRDGKGNFILIHVATMKSFLESLYGDASWGMSKNPGTILDFGTIPHWKGVLAYDAGFSGATGHVDLWTGDSCHNHCPDPDVALAYGISLWKLA